ncbi:hypothetical protein B0T22DRAFT_221592 [Podospora appendiculata]|uniref:Uncharacterized protein n=1 Tax=Podospora appendiculata TaxID=314037 RepID=A0AAE1CAG9_9PEZI|nr:hypothetical protein B0T22DRAFT_221592 [Podospora appendiculata]
MLYLAALLLTLVMALLTLESWLLWYCRHYFDLESANGILSQAVRAAGFLLSAAWPVWGLCYCLQRPTTLAQETWAFLPLPASFNSLLLQLFNILILYYLRLFLSSSAIMFYSTIVPLSKSIST